MFRSLRTTLFTVREDRYNDPVQRQRAGRLLLINWAIFSITTVWQIINAGISLVSGASILDDLPGYIFLIVITYLIFRLIQGGRVQIAAWGFILALLAILAGISSESSSIGSFTGAVVIPIIMAGVLLGGRGLVFVAVLASGIIFLSAQRIPEGQTVFLISNLLVVVILPTLILLVFSNSLQQIASSTYRELAQVLDISRYSATLSDLTVDQLIQQILDYAQKQLQFGFVQVIVLDEAQQPDRMFRSGLGVQQVITRNDIAIGSASSIFEAIAQRQSIRVRRGEGGALRVQHLNPTMEYGLSVPILHQDTVLAVIDVQNETSKPIRDPLAQAVELLAGQTAIHLQHAQESQIRTENQREQSNTIARLQQRLNTFVDSERSVMQSGWDVYLGEQRERIRGYNLDALSKEMIPARDLPPELRAALSTGEIRLIEGPEQKNLVIPVVLKDEFLGVMSFTVPPNRPITERQLDMARNITNRLAVALENRRLFEQTQAQAEREARASEAAAKLLSTTDVSEILHTAARMFNEVLGAVQTQVSLESTALTELGEAVKEESL